MTENYQKSKEEIALELMQIILSSTINSYNRNIDMYEQTQLKTILDNDNTTLDKKNKWCLQLFIDCLKAVKGE